MIQPGFAQTMRVVAHIERSPPLYYSLAWLWSKLFGTGEVGLRSLSAVFGTLTVPAAYLAARELVSRRAGLIAAGLVALNPYLIWYSQEARSYALYALFSAWALCFFARAVRGRGRRSLALWALSSTLALGSHYFAVFLIVPEALVLARAVRPRRRALAAIALPGLVGAMLVPLAVAQEGAGPANLFRSRPLVVRAGQALLDFVASVEPSPFTGGWAVGAVQALAGAGAVALLVAALALVLRRGSPPERRAAAALGLVAGASFALPLLVAAAGLDYVEPRKVLIGSVVPLLGLTGVAFGCRRAGKAGFAGAVTGLAIFAGVLVAVFAAGPMQRPDWRAVAAAIGPARSSRVLVVAASGQVPLAYYLHAQEFGPRGRTGRILAPEIDTLGRDYAARSPGHPFRLVRLERVAGSFWLRVYRAPRPLPISAREVRGDRVLDEPSLDLANRVPGAGLRAARASGPRRRTPRPAGRGPAPRAGGRA